MQPLGKSLTAGTRSFLKRRDKNLECRRGISGQLPMPEGGVGTIRRICAGHAFFEHSERITILWLNSAQEFGHHPCRAVVICRQAAFEFGNKGFCGRMPGEQLAAKIICSGKFKEAAENGEVIGIDLGNGAVGRGAEPEDLPLILVGSIEHQRKVFRGVGLKHL